MEIPNLVISDTLKGMPLEFFGISQQERRQLQRQASRTTLSEDFKAERAMLDHAIPE